MPLHIRRYPLDLTGRNPNNLIIGERHDLIENSPNGMRSFVLNYGSFYSESLVIIDAQGNTLRPHDDYIATYLYQEATRHTGKEICGAVVILNPTVLSPVYVDYQVVGGDYAQSTDALAQVIQALAEDERAVEWGQIVGKPSEYPPGGHHHAIWELYGFEYVVAELERIAQAIMTGDQAAFEEVREYARTLQAEAMDYTDELALLFNAHKDNTNNPHNTTKQQVGLGLVENYPPASNAEAWNGTANRYVLANNLKYVMDQHRSRGEHDDRYVRINTTTSTSLRVNNGRLYAYIDSSRGWKQIWPATWMENS